MIRNIIKIVWYVVQALAIYSAIILLIGIEYEPYAVLAGYLVFMFNLFVQYGRPRRYLDEWENQNQNTMGDDKTK